MLAGAAFGATPGGTVTFYKDVLPVLQKNCQACHRPGEAAPMSFLTYKEVRPLARAIKEAVILKKMPPWFADPHFGKFSNDRSLSPDEIRTLVSWADTGAAEGNPKEAPAPRTFVNGWNIGTPDMVIKMSQALTIPAKGTLEYTYFVVPTNFTEDRWVQAAEVRPGNRAVVHHVIAFVREPGSKWLKDAKPGVPYTPVRQPDGNHRDEDDSFGGEMLVPYAPGLPPTTMRPGQAKLIKAGSDLVLQMHYTANNKEATDLSSVGLIFAKEPPRQRVMTVAAANGKFVIPAGASAHPVESKMTLWRDVELVSLLPHMHLRGKSFQFQAVYPTGERQTLLDVPHYDFNWQLVYYNAEPIILPKGTRMECFAKFDNSTNNKFNPDPTVEVRFGEQSWEEMMIGFYDVAFEAKLDPSELFRNPNRKKPSSGD